MSPRKKNTASGVITFHTPFDVSLLKSENSICMADLKDASESRKSPSQPSVRMTSTSRCVRAGNRDEASPSGLQQGPKQAWLSSTSLRQLQAKMEAENQQKRELIQPLVDTENGFMKELECFLNQHDVAELRRKELLHKRWTERVWMPLQRKVKQYVSSCSPEETKRLQSKYSHSLHDNSKLNTDELKDSLYLQFHERLKEKRTARSYEAGYKYKSRQIQKLPQTDRPLSESVTPQANILPQASSYLVSASRQTPVQDETDGRKSSRSNLRSKCVSSRLDTIPYYISATTTPDGRCQQTGCWFSR